MSTKPPEDPILELAVERALESYQAILPPGHIEEFRRMLRFGLATDPRAQEILRVLRVREVQRSGTTVTEVFEEEGAEKHSSGGS